MDLFIVPSDLAPPKIYPASKVSAVGMCVPVPNQCDSFVCQPYYSRLVPVQNSVSEN